MVSLQDETENHTRGIGAHPPHCTNWQESGLVTCYRHDSNPVSNMVKNWDSRNQELQDPFRAGRSLIDSTQFYFDDKIGARLIFRPETSKTNFSFFSLSSSTGS